MTTLRRCRTTALALAVLAPLLAGHGPGAAAEPAPAPAAANARRFTDRFDLAACRWAAAGGNDFMVLEPGHQDVYSGIEGGDSTVLEITVLEATRVVDGVETRIVEERESRRGVLVESSRNYFAVCGPGNDVFYFGEDVDMYEAGKVKNHDGSWIAGKDGARPGLFMAARPLLGARYYQEVAAGVAMDRVEVTSDSESLTTPAGTFADCLQTEETTPLAPAARETKAYARGVGLVQDGDLLLSRRGGPSPAGR